jgi:hypothetical protein
LRQKAFARITKIVREELADVQVHGFGSFIFLRLRIAPEKTERFVAKVGELRDAPSAPMRCER